MKDTVRRTMKVRCGKQNHTIALTTAGRVVFLNHTKEEFSREANYNTLGGELSECGRIKQRLNCHNFSELHSLGFGWAGSNSRSLRVAWGIQQRYRRQQNRRPALKLDGSNVKAAPAMIANRVGVELHQRNIPNWVYGNVVFYGQRPDTEVAIELALTPTYDNLPRRHPKILQTRVDSRGPINIDVGFSPYNIYSHRVLTADRPHIDIDQIADTIELSLLHKRVAEAAEANKNRAEARLKELKEILDKARLNILNSFGPELPEADQIKPKPKSQCHHIAPLIDRPKISLHGDETSATYSLNIEIDNLTFPGAMQTLERLEDALEMVGRTTRSNYKRLKAPNRVPGKPRPGIG